MLIILRILFFILAAISGTASAVMMLFGRGVDSATSIGRPDPLAMAGGWASLALCALFCALIVATYL